MSTRRDTRYSARRRAANKKRMRDLIRYIAVFGFIGILIVGTVSTVLITTSPTVATTGSPTATSANAASLSNLVTQGDAAIASGDYRGGISYYLAYSTQNSTDTNVLFKIGKAYVDPKNPSPDYLAGLSYLQQALNANQSASWASEASSLINQYASKAIADVTATALSASTVTTGTGAITGTKVITGSSTSVPGSGTAPSITSTTVITK